MALEVKNGQLVTLQSDAKMRQKTNCHFFELCWFDEAYAFSLPPQVQQRVKMETGIDDSVRCGAVTRTAISSWTAVTGAAAAQRFALAQAQITSDTISDLGP
eukprot:6195492-Pleurochrysis_carterae.AAC.5